MSAIPVAPTIGAKPGGGVSAEDLAFIQTLVRARSAIVLDASKGYLIESRLAPVIKEAGIEDLRRLVLKLKTVARSPLHDRVVEAMTTNETSFFRDLHPFEGLRKQVLPKLIDERRATRTLTIWCAAASSGQEPYSIAMTIREHFPELATWKVKIIATDLASGVLARAKEGRYSQLEVNRGLPAALLTRYFERHGTEWRVAVPLRSMVDFREMNLIEPWPAFPPVDIVFVRNVMIYFDVPTKREILRQVTKLLRPDGVLFLGSAETTINLANEYERVQEGKAAWYRLKEKR